MRRRFHDRPRALGGVRRLEDAGADEDRLGAEHAAEGRVGGRRDAAGREVRDREPAVLRDPDDELERGAEVLGGRHPLVLRQERERLDLARDLAQVPDGVDDVARARLALRADHRGPFADPPKRLAEVPAAAHERHLEVVLVDVVLLVGGSQHLGLVDEVHAERLEDPRLGEVADAALRHHGDRDGGLDLADLRDRRHARDAAVPADVGRARARAP